jgi:hypothetical protein
MGILDWFKARPEPTNVSRRRLLQVLAIAPFAPWQEILEEAAKPKIFYSIPPTWEAAVMAIEIEAFAKDIPRLFYKSDTLYKLFNSREPMAIGNAPFRIPLRYQSSGVITP